MIHHLYFVLGSTKQSSRQIDTTRTSPVQIVPKTSKTNTCIIVVICSKTTSEQFWANLQLTIPTAHSIILVGDVKSNHEATIVRPCDPFIVPRLHGFQMEPWALHRSILSIRVCGCKSTVNIQKQTALLLIFDIIISSHQMRCASQGVNSSNFNVHGSPECCLY